MKKAGLLLIVSGALGMMSATSAMASFHFMQIEQVVGGVNGDLSAQAIMIRTRSAGQNLVSQGRINVRDAAGMNPVLIVDMTTNVSNSAGDRSILIASAAFLSQTTPAATADFMMTNLIPPTYLCAGSLTFEDDFGTIYWRLSWGGTAYTGAGSGSTANDSDGNFNPPFAGPLPNAGLQALRYSGTAASLSTNNAAQYALTPGASTWRNNANVSYLWTLSGSTSRGACCNGLVCTESVTAASCTSPMVWTQGSPCCAVTCVAAVTGACCDPTNATCNDNVNEDDCDAPLVFTANMDCDDISCVPTMSEWGLIVVALLLLTAGTYVAKYRLRAA